MAMEQFLSARESDEDEREEEEREAEGKWKMKSGRNGRKI